MEHVPFRPSLIPLPFITASDAIQSAVFAPRAQTFFRISPPEDALRIDAVSAFLPNPPRQEIVQAGANITITRNALGPVIAASGGGGGGGTFGIATIPVTSAGLIHRATIPAAWVTSTIAIVCSLAAQSAGFTTPEMVMASGCIPMASALVAGVSFDIVIYNPNGFDGSLTVHYTGGEP